MNKYSYVKCIHQGDTNHICENTKKTGLNHDKMDKFYTKEYVVDLCLGYVKQYIKLNKNDLIVEPSAGNGSFILGIKSLSQHFIFYDLTPENPEIIEQDYLDLNFKILKSKYNNIHTIGNPPFGRQSSLAIRFIKKSCEFCSSISFILPKSFKKDSIKRKIPLSFHVIFEIDLPDNSFLVNGKEHNVPCVFQIWEKQQYDRILCDKLKPLNFIFVKKTNDHDIAFRRIGVNAGSIYIDSDIKSVQSHYFIKFTNNKNIYENIKQLSQIKYDFNNTVGPKSISKQELIFKFNPLL